MTTKAIVLPDDIDPTVVHRAIELISEWEPGARVVTLTHHVVWNCYEHEDHEENCFPETEWWQTNPQEVQE